MFELRDCTNGDKSEQAKPVLRYRTRVDEDGWLFFEVYDKDAAEWLTLTTITAAGRVLSDSWHDWPVSYLDGRVQLTER